MDNDERIELQAQIMALQEMVVYLYNTINAMKGLDEQAIASIEATARRHLSSLQVEGIPPEWSELSDVLAAEATDAIQAIWDHARDNRSRG